MRLKVHHVTTYRYDRPVRAVIQSHRLRPAENAGQKVLNWQVEVSGGARGGSFRDGSGDLIEAWTVQGPVSEVVVTVEGLVETSDTAGVLRGHRETLPPVVWLLETPATEPDLAITELARETLPEGKGLELAHALAAAVSAALSYDPEAGEEAPHTAAAALERGAGVCRDHAQLLIALARLREIPARYVTGYLHATADGEAHEASHAWAELWVEGLGWIGFDPANACCSDARYIRLGTGRDALDAAPIKGVSRGDAEEEMEIAVSVSEAAAQSQSQQ